MLGDRVDKSFDVSGYRNIIEISIHRADRSRSALHSLASPYCVLIDTEPKSLDIFTRMYHTSARVDYRNRIVSFRLQSVSLSYSY